MNANHYPQSVKSAFRGIVLKGAVGFITSNVQLVEDTDRRQVYRAYTKERNCYELVSAKVDRKRIYYMDDVSDPAFQERVHPAAEHDILMSIIDYNEELLES